MLEHTRLVDHAVWVVALALYAYDAARLLGPHDVLLVEAGRGRLTPMLSDPPFTSWTRVLTFAPLHAPHRGVLRNSLPVTPESITQLNGPRRRKRAQRVQRINRLQEKLTEARTLQ